MKKCFIIVAFAITIFSTILISAKAIRVYSVYNDNYRDTIYIKVEPHKPKYSKYYMAGFPNGVVQSQHRTANKNYIQIRSLNNGKLLNVEVGFYDYKTINIGDTIEGVKK